MSLVAYGSSDESENEEGIDDQPQEQTKTQNIPTQVVNINSQLQLPVPKLEQPTDFNDDSVNNHNVEKLNFNIIPKPKLIKVDNENLIEESDNAPIPNKINYGNIEKPPKPKKGPIKISIPSLADVRSFHHFLL
jgi:hypothetical protein